MMWTLTMRNDNDIESNYSYSIRIWLNSQDPLFSTVLVWNGCKSMQNIELLYVNEHWLSAVEVSYAAEWVFFYAECYPASSECVSCTVSWHCTATAVKLSRSMPSTYNHFYGYCRCISLKRSALLLPCVINIQWLSEEQLWLGKSKVCFISVCG